MSKIDYESNSVQKGMMLTAGLGTRLRPVTDLYAKPAVPFLGIPLLYYPLHLMLEAGVQELTLNTHYKAEQIDALASTLHDSLKLKVHLSHEAGLPLGSGGGIWKARATLTGGDFLVSNGDEVILPLDPQVIAKFASEHRKHQALATILVMKHPLVGSQFGGVWADPSGKVLGFGKDGSAFQPQSKSPLTGYHYIGLLLLSERIFDYLPAGESNILYDALTSAIAKGEKVRSMVSDFTWFETGNPRDYLAATGEALALMHKGQGEDAKCLRRIFSAFGPATMKLVASEGSLSLRSQDAVVDSTAKLSGFSVLERNAVVERGASVENSVVLQGAVIRSGHNAKNEIVLP